MGTDQLKELKRHQKENERLRKAVSDLTLDKLILSEAGDPQKPLDLTAGNPSRLAATAHFSADCAIFDDIGSSFCPFGQTHAMALLRSWKIKRSKL